MARTRTKIEDDVDEAKLKNKEKKTAQEAQEAAQTVQEPVVEKTPA